MNDSTPESSSHSAKNAAKSSLLLASIGVVFGDIGTSPLYALRECFSGIHAISPVPLNVLGSVSLIFWFLVLIVCIKYVAIFMKADNKGEGGIMALMALIDRISPYAKKHGSLILFLTICGAALLFSDAIITPAVSVLSAIEGLTVRTPFLHPYILPIATIILIALFFIQSKGTAKIGSFFGPVILMWFFVIGILGIFSIIKNPSILMAVNPYYAVHTLISNSPKALALIGTVFLSVTGAEVLYADIGHFGKQPIRRAWFFIVFPSLILNYMGQGAYLLNSNGITDNLFYRLAPTWFILPLVALATLATTIASQAVITGMFSSVRQAVQLGFWPRLKIVHTSADTIGQVYVPLINLILCICTLGMIFSFKNSGNLASAYGIAVSATMLITTILALFVARQIWHAPKFLIIILGTFFILLNSIIFAANLVKLVSGGWVVVMIAAILTSLMFTWISGRKVLGKRFSSEFVPLSLFLSEISTMKPIRVDGTAVFLSANVGAVPRSLLHNYKHNKVLHATTILLSIQNQDIPSVPFNEKISVNDVGEGFYQVVIRYGFMENPNVPRTLSKIHIPGVKFDHNQITYFLGKEKLVLSKRKTMPKWQKHIFQYLTHNSLDATSFFGIPANRVVELGMHIEL
jgi:KUP system potassium uptake protein